MQEKERRILTQRQAPKGNIMSDNKSLAAFRKIIKANKRAMDILAKQ